MKIRCHGGLYDGYVCQDEFPFPTREFLIREEPQKILPIDRARPNSTMHFVRARYELAKTISGDLVYVPTNFYLMREDHAETGEVPGTPEGGDTSGAPGERPAD